MKLILVEYIRWAFQKKHVMIELPFLLGKGQLLTKVDLLKTRSFNLPIFMIYNKKLIKE